LALNGNLYASNIVSTSFNNVSFPQVLGGALSDESTVLVVSTAVNVGATMTFRMPFNWRISSAKLPVFSVNAAPSTTLTLAIYYGSSPTTMTNSLFSTNPTIAASAFFSTGGVLTTTTLTEGTFVRAYLSAGASSGAYGLKVYIYNS